MKHPREYLVWSAELPIIADALTMERLWQQGEKGLDDFLLRELDTFSRMYKAGAAPELVYRATYSVLLWARQFPSSSRSFQFARLEGFVGSMLVFQGRDRQRLEQAVDHFRSSMEKLRAFPLSDEVVKARVGIGLLLGVARKSLGQHSVALRGMSRLSRELTWKHDRTALDVVPLARQAVIMDQTVASHRTLAEEAVKYADTMPKEYYRSVKRVFEFVLNCHGVAEADALFPEFRRAFAAIEPTTEPLARISFLKNLGQYALLRGEEQAAATTLRYASTYATTLGFEGQQRQIEHLWESSGTSLVTFRFPE